jgi:integrase
VKAPKVKPTPTLPFSDAEMRRILEACDRYAGNRDRLRAFVLVMRHSGLRIGDTIALSEERLSGNKLLLFTAKTGTPVYVPLPDIVMRALTALDPTPSGRYFSTGAAKPQTARANWSRYLDTLFELAHVPQGHSHRFRDTFAVSLLLNGVSLENVSRLLGHSSIRITERHYAPWVKARQTMLEAEVRRTWENVDDAAASHQASAPRASEQPTASPVSEGPRASAPGQTKAVRQQWGGSSRVSAASAWRDINSRNGRVAGIRQ